MKKGDLLKALRFALPGTESSAGGGMDRVLFDGEWIRSFNESVSVSYPFKTDMEIAVRGEEFYQILNKMSGEDIDLKIDDDKLIVMNKKTKLKLYPLPAGDYQRLKANILSLNVETWNPLDKGFSKGIALSIMSGFKENRLGKISGVAFQGKDIVSTDNFKVSQYIMESPLTDEMFRLRVDVVIDLVRFGKDFDSFSINKLWLSLKTKEGMVVHARMQSAAEYPIDSIKGVFDKYNDPKIILNEFPKGLEESLSRVEVLAFHEDEDFKTLVDFYTEGGELVLGGKRSFGEIEDRIDWDVELPGKFQVTPAWVKRAMKETRKFKIVGKTLFFETPNWKYLILTKKV